MTGDTPLENPIVPPASEQPSPDLDGHSMEELGDYLDRHRTPADASIENSAGCRIALAALTRLRDMSGAWIEAEASRETPRDDSWVLQILALIGQEARAGRSIPLSHPSPDAHIAITEGAVRGIIRAAGDRMGAIIIGRVRLTGDVTTPGEPVTVDIDATTFWGHNIQDTVAEVRAAIGEALATHTELNIAAIDVTVHDIQVDVDADAEPGSQEPASREGETL